MVIVAAPCAHACVRRRVRKAARARPHDSIVRRLVGSAVPHRVIASFNNETGDRCIDVFQREDGTFGFEEFRRDHEDLRGWFSLRRYGTRVHASEAAALGDARSSVQWLGERIGVRDGVERGI